MGIPPGQAATWAQGMTETSSTSLRCCRLHVALSDTPALSGAQASCTLARMLVNTCLAIGPFAPRTCIFHSRNAIPSLAKIPSRLYRQNLCLPVEQCTALYQSFGGRYVCRVWEKSGHDHSVTKRHVLKGWHSDYRPLTTCPRFPRWPRIPYACYRAMRLRSAAIKSLSGPLLCIRTG